LRSGTTGCRRSSRTKSKPLTGTKRNRKSKSESFAKYDQALDELKEKKKEWLKKRVLLPEDQADGDAGTVVQVEQRAKTKKRKGGWWFKIDWDDAEEEDDIDPWVDLRSVKLMRQAYLDYN